MLPVFPEAVSVRFLTDSLGLYLHIPFCEKKCRYCDFYSTFCNEELLDSYTNALIKEINQWGGKVNRPIDTIYLGGGTPSLLGERLPKLLKRVKSSFNVAKNCEITLELNPKNDSESLLEYAKEAEINRLSIGAQTGSNQMLSTLGRGHSAEDTVRTFKKARELGFKNISLDLMICLPSSNTETLSNDLDFITSLKPEHISAYMLKIEENTAFYNMRDRLNLPCEEQEEQQYLLMCDYLEKRGYTHYEISNFCKGDNFSRHNMKYWKGEEYLGIGPAAHSFYNGERFFYTRDLKAFLRGGKTVTDSKGGGKEEFIMLNLRLRTGISNTEYKNNFGEDLPRRFFQKCENFEKHGFLKLSQERVYLTNKGMLLSNSIITELLECIE